MKSKQLGILAFLLLSIESSAQIINLTGKFSGTVVDELNASRVCDVTFYVDQADNRIKIAHREYMCPSNDICPDEFIGDIQPESESIASVLVGGKKVGYITDSFLLVDTPESQGTLFIQLRPNGKKIDIKEKISKWWVMKGCLTTDGGPC